MQTFSGRKFYPLDPMPEEIYIEDIASALSNLCRFGGQVQKFYSVAEHSILISRKLGINCKLWGLLHDAGEAYVQDLVKPLKLALPEYKKIEMRVMDAVVIRFGLNPVTMPMAVEAADICILNDEHRQVMKPGLDWWHDSKTPLGVDIEFWEPTEAMDKFIKEYKYLGGKYVPNN